MAICVYHGKSNRGLEKWGRWQGCNHIEQKIVGFCRRAFKGYYRNMWIAPIYFDDKYFRFTKDFYSEVGVELYPRRSDIPKKGSMGDDQYKALLWDIAHKDIWANINKGVESRNVVIRGVRILNTKEEWGANEKGVIERIKCIKEVKDLPIEEEERTKWYY